ADENEEPGAAKLAQATIGQKQGKRDRKPGNCERERDDLLDDPRQPPSPYIERVGRRHARDQRERERRKGDHEGKEDRAGIELPDLHDPLQRHTRRNTAEIVRGDASGDRERGGHHKECRNKQREDQLAVENQAVAHAQPAAATALPENERASIRNTQVMMPSPTESAAEVAKFAARVNSV